MLPADPRLEHTSVTDLLTKPQVSQPLPAPLSVVGCALHRFSHVWLCATPWTVARRAPLSIGSPRPEYWSRLPFPSPGHLSDPENEPGSPALQAGFFTTDHWGSCSVSLHNPPPFSGSLCSDPKGLPSAPRTACSSHHRASAGSAPFSLPYFTRFLLILRLTGFPSGSAVKNLPAMQEMQETPDSLHATRLQRVSHDPTQPRDPASVCCTAGRSSLSKPPGKPLLNLTIC